MGTYITVGKLVFNKPTPPFIFGLLFKKQYNFLQQINVNKVMSIQYMALGFEPTTSQTWVVSRNH